MRSSAILSSAARTSTSTRHLFLNYNSFFLVGRRLKLEFKIRKTTTKTKITRREPHSESGGGTKLQINKKYSLLILNPKVRRNSKSQFPTNTPYLSFHSLYFPKKFSSSLFSDHKKRNQKNLKIATKKKISQFS